VFVTRGQSTFSLSPFYNEGHPVAPRRAAAIRPTAIPTIRPVLREPREEVARQTLEHRIAAHVGQHVPDGVLALSLTDNRYTMISVKRDRGTFHLRLHHMFLDAAPEVVRALGEYVAKNDREASRLLGRFIDINQRKIRRPRGRTRPVTVPITTSGTVHDLREIYDDLNRRYFAGAIDARITWGQRPVNPDAKMKQRSSMKMGSYSVEDRLIRIHPSLDRAFVPPMFVAWIVYHEMLHQKHDIPVRGGRRQFHTPEFLAEEARFEHHHLARLWERENLDRLLYF
jgi:predicted metal-dependent hydrolase